MKRLFIFNPHSGRNRARPWLAGSIREFIAARRLDARLAITEGPGHATQLAREGVASGHGVVVAVGGDGTMNEVAQGLIHSPATLALVPCGSGNGLARHLGLPHTPAAALQLASGVGAGVMSVDTGTANGLPFVNAMGLGLDADVSHRFNRLTRRGLPAYARVAYSALKEMRSERCVIETNGDREVLDILLVAVANSDQYGNNARIAPGASVIDGRLDLVAIKALRLPAAALLVPRLFLGNIDRSRHVRRKVSPRFVIERECAGLIHTDGETHETGSHVVVEARPASLRILVPVPSRAGLLPFRNPARSHVLQPS